MTSYLSKRANNVGTFALTLVCVSAAFNLRNLPLLAQYGIESLLVYPLAALCFLLPCGLACAELSSGWPNAGGMYVWIREAFGHRAGVLAIWIDWITNLIWFPMVLSFMVGTLAYLIRPELTTNKVFMCTSMLSILWIVTLLNFLGINFSIRFSGLTALIGSLAPCLLLIILGLFYLMHYKTQAIANIVLQNNNSVLTLGHYSYISGLILSFAGIEAAGLVAYSNQDLKHHYPRAIFISLCTIVLASLLGALAMGFVIPPGGINLVSGVMQAFQAYLAMMHLQWITPLIVVLTLLGSLSSLNTWIAGPPKSLMIVAADNQLPAILLYQNKKNSPTILLFIQAFLSTLLTSIFLWMPTVSDSYWLLSILTAQLTLIMYMLLFASVIRLRKTQPLIMRLYPIPGGKQGAYFVCGIGIITCLFAIGMGFIPPEQLHVTNVNLYECLLLGGFLIALSPVLLFKKKRDLEFPKNHIESSTPDILFDEPR